jgi:cytochrome b561
MIVQSFTKRARAFHYAGLVAIIALVLMGFFWKNLPEDMRLWGISLHKLFGFGMLWVILTWIASYASSVSPLPPEGLEKSKILAARIVKILLLGCALTMASSGWLMASAANKPQIPALGISLPSPLNENLQLAGLLRQIHETTGLILAALIAGHALAALYHHLIRKDVILSRMFPFISAPK